MGFIPLALAVFQLVFRIWDTIHERNSELKVIKSEALKDGIDAITKKDPASITAVFDHLNRIGRL